MGRMSRNKGKAGELELVRHLKNLGFNVRRGQQYCGANGDADVVGLPNIHIECKRVEALHLYDAMEQARSDAREGEIPVVMHRRNNCRWVAVMYLDDFAKIYGESSYCEDKK